MCSRLPSLLFAAVLGSVALPGQGKVFLSTDEALALAFPGCQVERRSLYPDAVQQARIAELAGSPLPQAVLFAYAATRDGALVGTAWFDCHRVRTLKETLMVVVDPAGKVARVEVLAFAEPGEYLPRGNFYAQFQGRGLDQELRLKGAIRGVTGASLTAVATVAAVRRVLAAHAVLQPPPRPEARRNGP